MKQRPTAQVAAQVVAEAAAKPAGAPTREELLAAVDLLREERVEEAEAALQHILQRQPTQADALHFMGVLRHTQGRTDEAVALIHDSLAQLPDNATAWNNLGNVLLLAGRFAEANSAYRSAVKHADSGGEALLALNNLCTLQRNLGHLADSEASARQALQRDPEFGDAWYNLSLTLLKQGRIHDALLAHSKAVTSWPEHLQPRHELIRGLMLLGELERASKLIGEWLEENPDNPIARHLLAACSEGQAPERASDAYVEQVFDGFAASFDAKLEKLGYRAPGLVVQALHAAVGAPQGALAICDAGCGTGLCGEGLKPYAKSLAGCDLSAGMLVRAKLLKHYDVLHKAELTHYLETQPGAFDAVVSADTLCYFGALEGAVRAAWCSLRASGWLIFTVEALPETAAQPHLLQPNGRYAHRRDYVEQVLGAAGFTALRVRADTLRMEAGEPVHGFVVNARKVVGESVGEVGDKGSAGMSGQRVPGTTCGFDADVSSLTDGTLGPLADAGSRQRGGRLQQTACRAPAAVMHAAGARHQFPVQQLPAAGARHGGKRRCSALPPRWVWA